MNNPNLAVKQRLEEASAAGDWDAAAALLDPHFVLHEPPAFPYGGAFRGIGGLRAYLPAARAYLHRDTLQAVRAYVSDDADQVTFQMRFKGKVIATGAPVDSTIMEVIEFRSRRLLSVRPHWFAPPLWR